MMRMRDLGAPRSTILLSSFLLSFALVLNTVFADIDLKRYNEGKDQYELIHHRSEMPNYGQCWRDTLVLLQEGCARLTDEIQTRLALAYLSCFIQIQGREALICDSDMSVTECAGQVSESDRSSLTTFFTHTQNMCYFLQSQVWHEETERTVAKLVESSSQVASRMEASHKLQEDILLSQNQSLSNQEMLMRQAYNLKDVINSSSDNVKALFEELKLSTREQGQIMGELFDQLKGLRSAIFGEVFGFYSLVHHVLAILVCYILTSTCRTSGARFWLFMVVTVNVIFEQTLLKFIAMVLWPTLSSDGKVNDELLYWLQKQVRRLALLMGMAILALTVYMYRDINSLNNQLLTEIRKQNSDICRFLSGRSPTKKVDSVKKNEEEVSDSDYTSDNEDRGMSDLSDADSDKTFILPENEREVSDTGSMCEEGEEDKKALMDELYDLKRSTPVREMEGGLNSWLNQLNPGNLLSPKPQHSYHLRKRPATPSPNTSPALRVESARSFSNTVEHLQKISEKNSLLFREFVKSQATPDATRLSTSRLEALHKEACPSPASPRYMTRQRSATPDSMSVSSRASSTRLAQRNKK